MSPAPGSAGREKRRMSGYAALQRAGPERDRAHRARIQTHDAGLAGLGAPGLVINCARSGKDRVKDFVIGFTSSPSTADERPVIPFVNLTGYPDRGSDPATGSCLVPETFS